MALEPGRTAPVFDLPTVGGGTLQPAFDRLTLLAFLKHDCPVCRLAAPYVEKFRQYGADGFQTIVVMEDPAPQAAAFATAHGLTAPVALDEAPYRVSERYRLTNVPTVFLVEPGGRIAETLVSWNRDGYNRLSAEVAQRLNRPAIEISSDGDGAPPFRPG